MNFSYQETVPFVLWQLEHYNLQCSRTEEAEIIGCSSTTVRKYDTSQLVRKNGTYCFETIITDPVLLNKLKDFPFPNRQIKTLDDEDKDYIWVAGENKAYKQPKQLVEIKPIQLSDLSSYNINLKNKYDIVWPKHSGLYMMAQVVCNPTKLNERFYLIKIGLSTTNLHNRISSYKGMNPMAICIDTIEINANKAPLMEQKWHSLLENKYDRVNNSEWFIVSFQDYLRFLENGFDIVL